MSSEQEIELLKKLLILIRERDEFISYANQAYQLKHFDEEDRFDKLAGEKLVKINEIRKTLCMEYQEIIKQDNIPDGAICYMSLSGKPIWFNHPYIREISLQKLHQKGVFVYFKIDGQDEINNIIQMKLYTTKYFGRELLQLLQKLDLSDDK